MPLKIDSHNVSKIMGHIFITLPFGKDTYSIENI